MEVQLSAEIKLKLTRLATEQGTDTEALVREAVQRFVDHDDWFRSEVSLGLEQIENGRTISHKDVGSRIGSYLASKQKIA